MLVSIKGKTKTGKTTAAFLMAGGAQKDGRSVAICDCEGGLVEKVKKSALAGKVTVVEPEWGDAITHIIEDRSDVFIIDGFDLLATQSGGLRSRIESVSTSRPQKLVVLVEQERRR